MYYGEKLNSISHLVGAVLALVGLGALLTVSIQNNDPMQLVSFSIFGGTMVLMYTMSTLYHSFHPPGLKKLFKIFDHVSIYILIAGSYTPFILTDLSNQTGIKILALVWSFALLGILSEVFLTGKAVKIGQVIIYLGMGWACSLDIDGLKASLPEEGFSGWWPVASPTRPVSYFTWQTR